MRLIDADVLKKDLTRFYDGEVVARKLIDEQPTVDAVPVVRCAVCRHFKCNMHGDGTLPNGVDEFECRNGRGGCDPMCFCDEGERKDGDPA